jgi:hypothetical protein
LGVCAKRSAGYGLHHYFDSFFLGQDLVFSNFMSNNAAHDCTAHSPQDASACEDGAA